MASASSDSYRDIDFRKHPELYHIGIGEQGVLTAQPYKGEILPHWRFKTPAEAEQSAKTIYGMYEQYKRAGDFVGMDMARKYLQMGFTRSRRYANHPDGRKYDAAASQKPQHETAMTSDKARSAEIFYGYYERVKNDAGYERLKTEHRELEKRQ